MTNTPESDTMKTLTEEEKFRLKEIMRLSFTGKTYPRSDQLFAEKCFKEHKDEHIKIHAEMKAEEIAKLRAW